MLLAMVKQISSVLSQPDRKVLSGDCFQSRLHGRISTALVTVYRRQLLVAFVLTLFMVTSYAGEPRFRIGIIGLTHGHAYISFRFLDTASFQVVGIVETNQRLQELYIKDFGIDRRLFYSSVTEMVRASKPQALAMFNKTNEHVAAVAECAPFKLPLMMEKPMANSVEDARRMAELARTYKAHLVVNFETTWHPSIQKAHQMAFDQEQIGAVFKAVFHMGTPGPTVTNSNKEFVAWLTDSNENPGGALADFGCYGMNLMTWFLKGEKPVSVYAVTKKLKPEKYPAVDDEADIVLNYKNKVAIIHASWDWPFARKDMELYGLSGLVKTVTNARLTYRLQKSGEQTETFTDTGFPVNESFTHLKKVTLGEVTPAGYEPGTVANNVIVTEILSAARKSAALGQAVILK